jgi:hypothetical protein
MFALKRVLSRIRPLHTEQKPLLGEHKRNVNANESIRCKDRIVSNPDISQRCMRIYRVNEPLEKRKENNHEPVEDSSMQRHKHPHVPLISHGKPMPIKNW